MSTEQQARQDVAARLRNRRVHLGLPLATVARHVGIDAAVLDDIEHGRVDPDDAVLRRLAVFHVVPVDDLLHGDPAVPGPPQVVACTRGGMTEADRETLVLFGLTLRRNALHRPARRDEQGEQR